MESTPRPLILAVDDDRQALQRISNELIRRYGSDYEIVCEPSCSSALERLAAARDAGERVAIVLADQWMPGLKGDELLAQVSEQHPEAKRALLIEWGAWGDAPTRDAVLRAMALGHIDYYVLKPWRSPDEYFHRMIAEFVHEWSRTTSSSPQEVVVVGDAWSRRAHELRSLLDRNGVPHIFHSSDSLEGREILVQSGQEGTGKPVVIVFGGRALVDPSNAELAGAYGVTTELDGSHDFDLIVIGAGPAGLAAAVSASSEGLRTLVIERESIGGQAGSSSLIRNYLGFSRGVSGAELAQRAYQQAWVFGTRFLLMREVSGMRLEGDRHVVSTTDGEEATARAVILAMGVSYRRLGIPGLEELTGAGVFYGSPVSEARALAGERVHVVGQGNSAGQAAMHLCRHAEQVNLVVRCASLSEGMSRYLQDEIEATPNIEVHHRTEVVGGGGEGRLDHLMLRDMSTDEVARVEAAALFVLIGARPHTQWLPEAIERDQPGFVLTGADAQRKGGWPLGRAPLTLETSVPGLFAVGDVRCRSVKRVASAVGDGSAVIPQVHEHLAAPARVATPP
jgi:thioredoxin reductase (NADPH)